MKTVKITKETNIIQRVLSLRTSRNKRYKNREFIVEGLNSLEQADKHKWLIKSLFHVERYKLSSWALDYIQNKKHVQTYEVSPSLMMKISDKDNASELLTIAQARFHSFADYQPRKPKEVIVVMDEPKSAGNLGMMIRTATAFGVSGVVVSGHGADEFDPKCVRSSVGTFFSMPIYHTNGICAFQQKIDDLRKNLSVNIIAAGSSEELPLPEIKLTAQATFIALGNERKGLSLGFRDIADQLVQIPLSGNFTSLNVAVAGSIVLYELFRQT